MPTDIDTVGAETRSACWPGRSNLAVGRLRDHLQGVQRAKQKTRHLVILSLFYLGLRRLLELGVIAFRSKEAKEVENWCSAMEETEHT